MRKKIVAGNWKMNLTYSEAMNLLDGIANADYDKDVQLIVAPAFPFIKDASDRMSSTAVGVGAQNCSVNDNGAYTGEVSVEMIQSVGAKYIIIGHSERRAYHGETEEMLSVKVDKTLAADITPIYCCGETLEERESGKLFDVIKHQIENGLFHLIEQQITNTVIAYEPVWAIGTGVTASSDQAQEMHQYIRSLLEEKYGASVANGISILYGGSCKPGNAKEIFAKEDVDGGLIGGAALKAEDFIAIANSF